MQQRLSRSKDTFSWTSEGWSFQHGPLISSHMVPIGSLDDMGHRCRWTMDLETALNSSLGPNTVQSLDGSNDLSGQDGSCDCMALDTTKASGYGQNLRFYVTLVATHYSDFSTGPGYSRPWSLTWFWAAAGSGCHHCPSWQYRPLRSAPFPAIVWPSDTNMVPDLGHFHGIL